VDRRGAVIVRSASGPFLCRCCRSYVTKALSGHCPRCGLAPPTLIDAPDPVRTMQAWQVWPVLVLLASLCALVIVILH
jgi:hypothetical protein